MILLNILLSGGSEGGQLTLFAFTVHGLSEAMLGIIFFILFATVCVITYENIVEFDEKVDYFDMDEDENTPEWRRSYNDKRMRFHNWKKEQRRKWSKRLKEIPESALLILVGTVFGAFLLPFRATSQYDLLEFDTEVFFLILIPP